MKDQILQFEEQNLDWLFDKFISNPDIREEWFEFVLREFEKREEQPEIDK